MFADYSPVPNVPEFSNYRGYQVVVLEGTERASDVIRFARRHELTSIDDKGREIFWIVFQGNPRQVWDLTAKKLRWILWSMRDHSDLS